jgi:type IV secretory pathway VirJ component
MRTVIIFILIALGLAAPAAAQPHFGLEQQRDAQAAADALAARNRDIALTNELAALQARAQSDQALASLQAARAPAPLPTPGRGAAPAVIDVSQLASIPDATLARSNAAVRAAADNRR